MGHTVWQVMCGNGVPTGMVAVITVGVHRVIQPAHQTVRGAFFVAVRGVEKITSCVLPSATPPIHRTRSTTAGFGVLCNPESLVFYFEF
jgi:hypothetical protein